MARFHPIRVRRSGGVSIGRLRRSLKEPRNTWSIRDRRATLALTGEETGDVGAKNQRLGEMGCGTISAATRRVATL